MGNLTIEAVSRCREKYVNDLTATIRSLAKEEGVSHPTMVLALNGKTWKDVDTPIPAVKRKGGRRVTYEKDRISIRKLIMTTRYNNATIIRIMKRAIGSKMHETSLHRLVREIRNEIGRVSESGLSN